LLCDEKIVKFAVPSLRAFLGLSLFFETEK
jgi:hypothetical protein